MARSDAGAADLAQHWQVAIAPTLAVAWPPSEIAATVHRWTEQTVAALRAPALDAAGMQAIGKALAKLSANRPEALQATQILLGQDLLAGVAAAELPAVTARLIAIIAALGFGFTEALRASEARFRAIYNDAGVGISLSDLEGRLVACNAVLLESMGYGEQEMLGRSFLDFLHPEDAGNAMERYQRVAAGLAEHTDFDGRVVRKDGSLPWAHVTVALMRDPDGKPQYGLAISENVTERKRTEAALAQQYQLNSIARSETRAVLDATNEGVVLLSLDGRVLSANRRFEELFQVNRDEARGRSCDDYAEQIQQIFGNALLIDTVKTTISDTTRRFAWDIVQHWPERRDLEICSNPVPDEAGTPLGRLFSFRDVSRERAADRLKSDFVSLVSHELRTPLTSIKGYVDLLLLEEVGPLSAEQRDFLAVVQGNADRLVVLINDLLDLSRLESGGVILKRSVIDVRQVIVLVAASFRPAVLKRQQELAIDVTGPLPAVFADKDRLVQVLSNLVSNAHKYTPAGGRISIRARADQEHVRIDVQDSGIGISREDQTLLFTRFFRSSNPTTQKVRGTGLGLMITRSLVLQQGGDVSVTSVPGEGSTFSFTLPIAQAARREFPGQ